MVPEQEFEFIQSLQNCMVACNNCYNACLQEDDVKMMAQCIRLDRECADMCAFLAQAVSRKSPFVSEMATVCAFICDACGNECKKHDHEHCQVCADACFTCAEACRSMM